MSYPQRPVGWLSSSDSGRLTAGGPLNYAAVTPREDDVYVQQRKHFVFMILSAECIDGEFENMQISRCFWHRTYFPAKRAASATIFPELSTSHAQTVRLDFVRPPCMLVECWHDFINKL
jgi:hypothetical protein